MKNLFVPLAFLAACTAAPPERVEVEPPFDIPERWDAGGDDTATTAPIENWWSTFGSTNLDAAITEALDNNQDLVAAAARVESAAAQARIAGADLYPTVNGGANGLRTRQNFIGLPIPGGGNVLSTTTNNFGVSLDVSWELDVWGRVRAGHSAAAADVQAALQDLAGARLSLVGQVTKAWFAAVEAQQQVATAATTVDSFRATVEDVLRLYERGARPALDLRQAELDLATAQANLDQQRELLERAVRQLEILLGRYPSGRLLPGGDFPIDLNSVPVGLPGEILQRRPDLRAAERRLAAAGARVDQARAALYPRLSLTGSGGTSSSELDDLADFDFRVWSIAGNVLAPIFQGGRLRADVTRNEAVQRELLATYTQSLLRAFSEVETALAVEEHLRLRERSALQARNHARAALDLARDRYQRGLNDFLTVATAQRLALDRERTWLQSRRLRLEARVDLFLALGGGFQAAAPDHEETQP